MSDRSQLPEIPNGFVGGSYLDIGWLPSTGVRTSSSKVIQGTSRSVWLVAAVLFVLTFPALVYPPLPMGARIGLALLSFGGAVSTAIAVPIMRRSFNVNLVADKTRGTVTVRSRARNRDLSWDSIIAIQLLESSPHARRKVASQLNLVYWDDAGEVQRLRLYSSAVRMYVRRVASRY